MKFADKLQGSACGLKSRLNGHGGQGVVMINEKKALKADLFIKSLAPLSGKDLRVWAIGNDIITSILREVILIFAQFLPRRQGNTL